MTTVLGRRDLTVIRALNIANQGYRRLRYGRVATIDNVTVFAGRPNRPCGVSGHTSGRVTHVPAVVYTAWRRGRLVGTLVRWACGGQSMTPILLDEPAYPLHATCALMVARRSGGVGVVVTVWAAP